LIFFFLAIVVLSQGIVPGEIRAWTEQASGEDTLKLPDPSHDSRISVEKALSLRKSSRTYLQEPLSLREISQLLWAAQGITRKSDRLPTKWNTKYEWQGGYRTAPSAGALFPMEIYLAAGNVEGLPKGVYKYIPKDHSLKKVMDGDRRMDVCDAALKQSSIKEGAALVIMAGVFDRTSPKYVERAERYVHIEVGSIAQNIYLQGITLGIGTVLIGAFVDDEVKKVLSMPDDEHPLAIMPLGKIQKD
jgi:SagB-type dehydrogenase family enzyme